MELRVKGEINRNTKYLCVVVKERSKIMCKIRKMMAGVMLSVSMLVCSVVPCYAVQNQTKLDLTKTRLYATFQYYETGHQLTLKVYYTEKEKTSGNISPTKLASNVGNGNVTDVIVLKNNTSGYEFKWGAAFGLVDGEVASSSGEISL